MKGKSLNDWNQIQHNAILLLHRKHGFYPSENNAAAWVKRLHYLNCGKYKNNFKIN